MCHSLGPYLNDVTANGKGLIGFLRIVTEPAVGRGIEHADADISMSTNCKPFDYISAQPLWGAHGLAKLRGVSDTAS